ncbi:MAG: DMT family transporter [Pseudomonadota bacterium]
MSAYIPSLLALLSAFMFAVSAHVQSMGLDGKNGQTASFVIIITTAGFLWMASPLLVQHWNWWSWATALFALSGLLRPTISISLWTQGIRYLGPTRNSALGATGPVFTAIFAFLIVGEQMTLPIAIGTGAVIAGILVTTLRGKNSKADWPLWAILFPLTSELCRAIAHSLTKVGFSEIPDPFFAALMATSMGAFALAVRFAAQRQVPDLRTPGLKYFVMTGAITSAAFYFLNVALELGKVITVIPIIAVTPVFAMLLSMFVFGRETLTWRTYLTIALVVPGVILVSLSR